MERLNGESSEMKGQEKGNRWRAIRGKKGRKRQNGAKSRDEFRGRKKIEDEKVDSEVYTVRGNLINPPNLVRDHGFFPLSKRLPTVYRRDCMEFYSNKFLLKHTFKYSAEYISF